MEQHGIQLDATTVQALVVKNGIDDADTFAHLTEQDLGELMQGMSLGVRNKIKRLVAAAKAPQQPSSPTSAAAVAPAATSLAEMTDEDRATTQRFAVRLPARYHLPIGDLELGDYLAAGGMGAVMTARLRSTREQCVMKLNKDRNPTAVRHFLREIYILLCMQHRFIARPLGVVFKNDELLGVEALLVLERGVCSLEDFVVAKRQQQSASAAEMSDAEIEQYSGFARQIATAMAFLHARGGLHLDLKPANVVLFSTAATATAPSNNNTLLASVDLATLHTAKIVDLGLAVLSRKELEEGFGGDGTHALTHITAATSMGATMAYASHEQANAGPDTKLRPTMDVYSFGAILYRLLCASRPHEGRSAMQIVQHKLIDDAMNEYNLLPTFRAASNADENSVHSVTARQLVAVMRMCLQHEPEQRPQTGTDVLRLLLREGEDLPAELAAPRTAAVSASASSLSDAIERARTGNHSNGAVAAASSGGTDAVGMSGNFDGVALSSFSGPDR